MTRIGLWLALLPVLVFGCNLSGESTPPPSEDKNPKIDACSLATREEVATIQGAKMLDPKSSEGPEIDFLLSQCYYGSAEPLSLHGPLPMQAYRSRPRRRQPRDC